ncbi:hypothetical protein HYN43_000810 [Mucilaginibacter celer]|uniref:Lipocalin-like domain-containing protein n=2 Tax=Mucilaginibacter celer TaxID=2305508 RepID=A0A494VKF3_9SPHI|nr:hypothetical protein HYN43_000810 [Mucilaginibacter celer]
MFFAAIICSITACDKNNPGPGNPSIVGKWRWVKSVGGIGGFTSTPKSVGYNLQDEFYADSTYKRLKNDTVLFSASFHTTKNYKLSATETVNLLSIYGPAIDGFPVAYVVRHDSLYLNNFYIADGENSVYVRIK